MNWLKWMSEWMNACGFLITFKSNATATERKGQSEWYNHRKTNHDKEQHVVFVFVFLLLFQVFVLGFMLAVDHSIGHMCLLWFHSLWVYGDEELWLLDRAICCRKELLFQLGLLWWVSLVRGTWWKGVMRCHRCFWYIVNLRLYISLCCWWNFCRFLSTLRGSGHRHGSSRYYS